MMLIGLIVLLLVFAVIAVEALADSRWLHR
jgi:hypothetical protein